MSSSRKKSPSHRLRKGGKVWIRDDGLCWTPGVVVGRADKNDKNLLLVRKQHEKEEVVVDSRHGCEARTIDNFAKLQDVENLTELKALSEPVLLETLEQRYMVDQIYTFCGSVLLAVNPFKLLHGVYGKKIIKLYYEAGSFDEMPPHVYSLASRAYTDLLESQGVNQTLLVNGESGAGKTETTKILMRCVTEMSQMHSGQRSKHTISQRILEANPILEAFGNAATIRNDNSSRFGKLIQMKFDPKGGALLGGNITSYLLEKSRLVHQPPGERNHHIFYALAFAGKKHSKRRWCLDCDDGLAGFHYISENNVDENDTYYSSMLQDIVKAMETLGFESDEIDQLFEVVAGILHLGNVSFDDSAGFSRISAAEDSMISCAACCDLLCIDADSLERAVCRRVITINSSISETIEKPLSIEESCLARDAFAMVLYERLFGYLVWRINKSLTLSTPSLSNMKNTAVGAIKKNYEIGILDVFGFEVFDRNGFEQFCINYCNERLQQLFNEFVLLREQTEYEEEGIDWTFVDYPDNSACIEMIESRPMGLLALIDENCLYPQGNDHTLCSKIYSNLPKRHRHLIAGRQERAGLQFTVSHFAGNVTYEVAGFHKKNKNELRQEAVSLALSSTHPIVNVLLPENANAAAGGADIAAYFDRKLGSAYKTNATTVSNNGKFNRNVNNSKLQQKTVVSHFKLQLETALDGIKASSAHYIRCLKPNDDNVDSLIDRPRIMEQLRYSGVIQVIQVAKAGYSSRFLFHDFLYRFAVLLAKPGEAMACIMTKINSTSTTTKMLKQMCLDVLSLAKLKEMKHYQIGESKLFLRQVSFAKLEQVKQNRLYTAAVTIQNVVRKYLVLVEQIKAAVFLQSMTRMHLAREEFRDQRDAILMIQRMLKDAFWRKRKREERKRKKKRNAKKRKAKSPRPNAKKKLVKRVTFDLANNKIQPIDELVIQPIITPVNFNPQPILIAKSRRKRRSSLTMQITEKDEKKTFEIVEEPEPEKKNGAVDAEDCTDDDSDSLECDSDSSLDLDKDVEKCPSLSPNKRRPRLFPKLLSVRTMVALTTFMLTVPLAFMIGGFDSPMSYFFACVLSIWVYTHLVNPDEQKKDILNKIILKKKVK